MFIGGLIQVFHRVEDTGIPALVEYVHSVTRVRRRCGIEKIIRNLGRFVIGVTGYLKDLGTQVDHSVDFQLVYYACMATGQCPCWTSGTLIVNRQASLTTYHVQPCLPSRCAAQNHTTSNSRC